VEGLFGVLHLTFQLFIKHLLCIILQSTVHERNFPSPSLL
jgi:hypothetical protein